MFIIIKYIITSQVSDLNSHKKSTDECYTVNNNSAALHADGDCSCKTVIYLTCKLGVETKV